MAKKPTYDELEKRVRELEVRIQENQNVYDLLEYAPRGVFLIDLSGTVLFANRMGAKRLGKEPKEIIGATLMDYFPLDIAEKRQLTGIEALKTGQPQTLEDRIGDRWYRSTIFPITGEDGNPTRLAIHSEDITDRKEIEDVLRKAHREWESIFQAIGHPTLILDKDHRLVHANSAAFRATGRPVKELVGLKCYEIFHNSDKPPEGCPFERMLKTGHLETVEMEIEALNGTFLVSCTPMLDPEGHLEKVIHIATDITEAKQTELALRESETYFREIIENASDIIVIVDEKGFITYTSPSVKRFLGYGPEELIGKGVFDVIHPDDIQRAMLDFAQAVQTEGTEIPNSFCVFHKDGSERVLEGLGKNLLHHPIVSGFIMNVHDVTESRRLQNQLLRAQKMEAIATLTGGIAHDYNNLVSIIMGNLGLAMQYAEPGSDLASFLSEAEKASRKVGDLTHELMALSKGGAVAKEPGNLAQLLSDAAHGIQSERGISLNTLIPDDLWPVPYDPHKMGSVFRNVLTNAVEAMPNGGTLTIRAENLHVGDGDEDLALPLAPGDYVKVTIEDQGKGISAQDLGKIFDPYFSTKPMGVQKGMGLGLATAHAIVKKHGGYIAVDSAPGKGTTVSIYLPATDAKRKVQSAERDIATLQYSIINNQYSIRRVLVMDDEDSLRNLAKKMLERLGYKAETVEDGPEAMEAYRRQMDSGEPFDAVILDLTIKGGMGGDQVIKELLKIDPNVRAIVYSGYFNDPVMANFKDYGFKGAMAKPFAMKDVETVLEKVL